MVNNTNNLSLAAKNYVILNPLQSFSSQVTVNNTIYAIRDVFDLNNQTVNLPDNCVLQFQGGVLKNGILSNGSNEYAVIESAPVPIFENISILGKLTAREVYAEWFGTVGSGTVQKDNVAIQAALNAFKCVKLLPKRYVVGSTIIMNANCTIEGSKGSIVEADGNFDLFDLGYFSNINNLRIELRLPQCNVFKVDANHLYETRMETGFYGGYTTGNACIKVDNIDVLSSNASEAMDEGNVIKLISDGGVGGILTEQSGFWGCDFTNISVYGAWKYVVYMDNGAALGNTSVNCWITDCQFTRIVCYGCQNFLYIGRNNQENTNHVTNKISNLKFVDCSLQYIANRSNFFAVLDVASRILFYRCFAWDWEKSAIKINPQTVDNIKYVHCDEAFSSVSRYVEFSASFLDQSNEFPIASIDLDRPYVPTYFITPEDLGYGNVSALTVGKIRQLPYGEYVVPNVLYATWGFFGFTINGFGYDPNASSRKVIFRKKELSTRIYLEFEFWGYTYSRASLLIERLATNNTALTDWTFEPKV